MNDHVTTYLGPFQVVIHDFENAYSLEADDVEDEYGQGMIADVDETPSQPPVVAVDEY